MLKPFFQVVTLFDKGMIVTHRTPDDGSVFKHRMTQPLSKLHIPRTSLPTRKLFSSAWSQLTKFDKIHENAHVKEFHMFRKIVMGTSFVFATPVTPVDRHNQIVGWYVGTPSRSKIGCATSRTLRFVGLSFPSLHTMGVKHVSAREAIFFLSFHVTKTDCTLRQRLLQMSSTRPFLGRMDQVLWSCLTWLVCLCNQTTTTSVLRYIRSKVVLDPSRVCHAVRIVPLRRAFFK